ncbi:MAG: ADP-ribosylglycohydrolase family protein [Oscillospiraceae bacterium]|jgi:ADP-ribosylglycohydrolase
MKGAIIGDIIGSIYEFDNYRAEDFPFFREECFFTDDTVMTIAVADALMSTMGASDEEILAALTEKMQYYGRLYPDAGYGGRFAKWLVGDNPKPYSSWGNGAPMRCSAAGWLASSVEEARRLGSLTAMPTHNHPEGVKAAALTAELIFLARKGVDMTALRERAAREYNLPEIDKIRSTYRFDVSSQGTMPVALSAFFESTSFEGAIRRAVSAGGDSDTIAAIAGSIAESYYGVPDGIWRQAAKYLDPPLMAVVDEFYGLI